MMSFLQSLPTLLNLIGVFLKIFNKTPQEERRESLAQLDDALKTAKEKDDLTELSKWLGKRL